MRDLYLDIDGVLLKKNGEPVPHLDEFIEFVVANFDCYWLTTHCKGNVKPALSRFKNKVSNKTFEFIKKIKPTNWRTWKTEAINFNQDFFWLDDGIFLTEEETLKQHNAQDNFIRVNTIFKDELLLIMRSFNNFIKE